MCSLGTNCMACGVGLGLWISGLLILFQGPAGSINRPTANSTEGEVAAHELRSLRLH